MKKGFTLIELLAVIVLLAIIAIIATPMILNIIEDSRKNAAEVSVDGYIDTIEKQIVISQLDSSQTQLEDGIHDLPIDNISLKGEQPSEGWVSIKNNQVVDYSIKVMDYIVTKNNETTKEGTIDPKPYICKRAALETLHIEGETTFGNPTIIEGTLTSGDAFDCDVNGDKDFDPDTERFYYVSGLDGDNTNDTKVLIYYNNTSLDENGKIKPDNKRSNLSSYYPLVDENWHGPVAAKTMLPKTSDWVKLSLNNPYRTIKNELGETTANSKPIENPFSYADYAARLLTISEINSACGKEVRSGISEELDNCNYLLENTTYANNSSETRGYWLENVTSFNSNGYGVYAPSRGISAYGVSDEWSYGVRPVIEVSKNDISY